MYYKSCYPYPDKRENRRRRKQVNKLSNQKCYTIRNSHLNLNPPNTKRIALKNVITRTISRIAPAIQAQSIWAIPSAVSSGVYVPTKEIRRSLNVCIFYPNSDFITPAIIIIAAGIPKKKNHFTGRTLIEFPIASNPG